MIERASMACEHIGITSNAFRVLIWEIEVYLLVAGSAF